ncbi:siderophore-interacting protein [Georgenia alba]|uniref:Siderophore-interacting protein n=1 Tax=Georgenia alba TaxID=2233858 RepID=A0ABW2Q2T7_9MICO
MSPPHRPPKPQIVLEVQRVERLAPHLIRVVAGGPGFASYEHNACTDRYVKLLFADPELGLTPPYDMAALREQLPPERMPSRRTYTLRWVDLDTEELAIDFVTHGDGGLAAPWAERARPGDTLVMSGPGGGYAPDPTADWHLLAGDDAALPAIAAALEALDSRAVGTVVAEVDGPEDEIALAAPPGVEVRWLHRAGAEPGTTRLLEDGVRAVPWRPGRVHVFAHGEREVMKALRDYLFGERGLAREHVSLSAYWAHGRAEDRFQAEKREPIGKIL